MANNVPAGVDPAFQQWFERKQAPPPKYSDRAYTMDSRGKRRYLSAPYGRGGSSRAGRRGMGGEGGRGGGGVGGPPRRVYGPPQTQQQPIAEPSYPIEPSPQYDVEQYNTSDIWDSGVNNQATTFVSVQPTGPPVPVLPPFTNMGDTFTPVDTAGGCEPTQDQFRQIIPSLNVLYAKPSRYFWNNGALSDIGDIVPSIPAGGDKNNQIGSLPAGPNYVDGFF